MKSVAEPLEQQYIAFGRDLADTLMRYARERRDEDKKFIAALHHDLCVLRRAEIVASTSTDPGA